MAKGPTYLRSIIPRLAKTYATADAAINALQRYVPDVDAEDVRQLWGEFRAQEALAPIEKGQDLRFKPTEGELLTQTVVRGKQYMHEVVVVGRTRSGVLVSRRVEVPVDQLTARWRAIQKAEETASGMLSNEGPKDTDLVEIYSGIHVGAYRRSYV
jgi:hypothetical protein